jgi:hypothetical protein
MKDFLILATITIIGGALIPSTGALAILAVVTSIVLVIAGKLGARGLQRVQEVPDRNDPTKYTTTYQPTEGFTPNCLRYTPPNRNRNRRNHN